MAFKINNDKGFSLLEVMIAITLFAFFVTAYLTSQSYNVEDSRRSEEQLILQQLAERKMNELLLNPPKFSNATQNSIETKTFDEADYKGYEYTIELKKLVIPDFGQLFAQKGNADQSAGQGSNYYNSKTQGQQRNSNLEKLVFDELKKNIERILWQARVTVTNKETKYGFALSTYLTNYNERVQLNVGF